jgi:hypothetical protein
MIRIKAQLNRERPVQFNQPRRGHRCWCDPGEKARWECRIAILEGEMDRHGLKMGIPGKLAIVNSRPQIWQFRSFLKVLAWLRHRFGSAKP